MAVSTEGATPRVLVILGHPRLDSFCGALAGAYEAGARAAGFEVERLDVVAKEVVQPCDWGLTT